ncbi:MAG: PEP-CTERM sorting domain-containing protein [Gammaproteobacteria bacterium]|nr:MAG: PEP-CTERM sorting domain-containing protein [Gammaproteobacteria bacterium]
MAQKVLTLEETNFLICKVLNMNNLLKILSAATLALSAPIFATPFVIDGDLSDWGVTVADNNNSQWNVRNDVLGYMVEDQNDRARSGGYLGPNYGGQNYDGEFMGVALSGNDLVIAISTGQRADNGFTKYSPGDLLIYTDLGIYALEMGGGKGATAVPVLTEGAVGSTYTLNRNGNTIGYADTAAAQVVGSIWSDVDFVLDPISPKREVQFEINGNSQMHGLADFVYTSTSETSQHAIYEMAFDLSAITATSVEKIFWAPSCGNDELYVQLDLPINIPEPAGIALFGLGILGLAGVRKRS